MSNKACLIATILTALTQAAPVPALSSFAKGPGCFENDDILNHMAEAQGHDISDCAEAVKMGGCQYHPISVVCECSCSASPPPPSPPTMPGWANGEELYDLSFGHDTLQTLDLYKTSAATEGLPPVPCILWVHGGGWSGGDKLTNKMPPEFVLNLRQRGFHIASTNYRLAPDDRHPAQIEDVESAVLYLKNLSTTHNLDPNKMVVMGNSAGGHLVSLLGTRNGPGSAARVAGVVDFYGATTLHEEDVFPVQQLLGCMKPSDPATACHEKALDASPITQVAADNVPFLIIHGTNDMAVPVNASKKFQAALEGAGASSTLIIVPGVGHDVEHTACGQSDGLVNTEHIYRWVNAKISPGAPCDSIVCGGGTVFGDAPDLYDGSDAFLSPYCLKARAVLSPPASPPASPPPSGSN